MSFENFFNKVDDVKKNTKKIVKNTIKTVIISSIGLMPMKSEAEQTSDSLANKNVKDIYLNDNNNDKMNAYKMIKEDASAYMLGGKEYYKKTFPSLNEEVIDSIFEKAKIDGENEDDNTGDEELKITPEQMTKKIINIEVLNVLYPDQKITNNSRYIPAPDWIVDAYKAGEFKTKEEFIEKQEQLSNKYNK